MATVKVTFRSAADYGASSIYDKPRITENFTSSASSQATTGTALQNEVARIVSSGGAVHIAYGASPTAAAGSGDLIPDGGSIDVRLDAGDKVAIIDA